MQPDQIQQESSQSYRFSYSYPTFYLSASMTKGDKPYTVRHRQINAVPLKHLFLALIKTTASQPSDRIPISRIEKLPGSAATLRV